MVKLNGEIETQKRKKIRVGDVVFFEGIEITVE
jgi:ribosome-associated protein YbcJ (S4-like RNA binding protein)